MPYSVPRQPRPSAPAAPRGARGRRTLAAVTGAVLLGSAALLSPTAASADVRPAAVSDEPDSLVALYDFSESDGTTLHDASGSALDAAVIGGAAWHDGYMQFTGANHVKLPDGLLADQSEATIVIETSPQALNGAMFLWNIGGTGGPTSGQGQFFIQPVAPRLAITKTNWSGEQTVTSATRLVEGQWQSVAATIVKNTDDATSTLRLFIDGVQVAEKTDSTVHLDDLVTHTSNFIGKSAYTADTLYQGKVSTFRVYDEALSASALVDIAETDAASAAAETIAALDLAEANAQSLDAVETDLMLPTAGGISWASSAPDVVAADGTVSQPASDTVVTLTAVSSVRGVQSAPREFSVTVLQDPAASDKAQRDLDAISIADADDVRANIALPASGARYGSALTWQSSDPEIVDVVGTAEQAPGLVSRPDGGDAAVTLTVTATIGGERATREIPLVVREAYDMPETTDYLFAHFTGLEGAPTDEQIYFATSRDAMTFTDTRAAGSPVLSTARDAHQGEGGVRDPFLVRSPEGDKVYLIATDLSIYYRGGWGNAHATEDGSTKLVIWESTDLADWSEPRLVDVAGEIPNAGMAWAPEAIWDELTGQYYVYWATRADGNTEFGDSVDIYMSATRDFRTFSTPVKWIDREHAIIDTSVIKVGDWYYRASGDGEITIERSKNLAAVTASALPATTGTDDEWVLVGTLQSILGGSGTCVGGSNYTGACLEGPEFFEYNEDDRPGAEPLFGLLADQYGAGRGYVPFRTTDLGSTSSEVWSKATDIDLGTIKKRHGGIVPITAEEYQRVMFHFAGVGTDPDLALTTAVTTRCVAGKTVLAVSVMNDDTRAADVAITTPFGEKSITALQPGNTSTQTVTTRQGEIPSASVAITGSANDASHTSRTFYDARTCG